MIVTNPFKQIFRAGTHLFGDIDYRTCYALSPLYVPFVWFLFCWAYSNHIGAPLSLPFAGLLLALVWITFPVIFGICAHVRNEQ